MCDIDHFYCICNTRKGSLKIELMLNNVLIETEVPCHVAALLPSANKAALHELELAQKTCSCLRCYNKLFKTI